MKTTQILFFLFVWVSSSLGQIINGGFENWTDGVPDEWSSDESSFFKGMLQSPQPHTGYYAIKFEHTFYPPTYPVWYNLFGNYTSKHKGSYLPSNKNCVSFWYKASFSEGIALGIGNYFVNGPGGNITTLPATAEWKRFTLMNPIPDSTHSYSDSLGLGFTLYIYNDQDTVSFYLNVDDISFDSIPLAAVRKEPIIFSLSIPSNPILSHANLRYNLSTVSPIHARLYGQTGREVLRLPSLEDASGSGSIPFDVDELPNGLYYLRCAVGGNVTMLKVIVQH